MILGKIKDALAVPNARIEIVDLSSDPVPDGRIEFLVERLSQPGRTDIAVPVVWSGSVVTDDNQRFPIWVKVRISAPVRQIVAQEDLDVGCSCAYWSTPH